ncbi:putative ATPase [Methanohalophilus euhalobius]|uniref:Predicted ATPase n=1 Tax=Methanohalophilus euhalobius TaxID=51203 RepID=A0A285F475_9EURY|nr:MULTISPECIES: DUF3696 domain-containing protein [Methanohalophilus]ODV49936.1 MAG: hypothetical protein A8273_595 [Methanohalophilus sp. 2-GBenrich]RXG34884.1 hypothetical protein CI957_478 [Methanohalophilus sp. WG1-DM]TCL12367.1 putative ATPase [Methanohalophilus euhalobius]SNY06088.1 Predicted ATPase [Methanohalophilus euhalobius]
MIKNIHLENFKGLQNSQKIDLKPLTVLCGTNSSGKSTIIQSLLLLKQTFENQSRYGKIVLNGQYVHMGSFKNIVYNQNKKNEVKISFEIEPLNNSITKRYKKNLQHRFLRAFRFINNKGEDVKKSLMVSYGLKLDDKTNRREPIINNFYFCTQNSSKNESSIGTSIHINHKKNNEYELKWKKTRPQPFANIDLKTSSFEHIDKYFCPNCNRNHRINSDVGSKHFVKYIYYENFHANGHPEYTNLIPEVKIEEGQNLQHLNRPLYSLRHIMEIEFGDFVYIGPLRKEPSRRYIYEEEYLNIGNKGENAPFILALEGKRKIDPYYYFDEQREEWELIENDNLEKAVNRWLKYMDISDSYNLESKEEIIRLYIQSGQYGDSKITLADVGFGVSQILPILVEGLRIKPRQTLILEQPEIHLHPKLQMKLADFFISMILSKKRIIVETHSDHLINRIVRRIIEYEDESINSNTNILFFDSINGHTQTRSVDIDEKRGIVDWPQGFFDQSAEEKRVIVQKAIEKRLR